MPGILNTVFRTLRRARAFSLAALLVFGGIWVGGCGSDSPTAPRPPTFWIFDAQWIGGTDIDGDGYWETRRLAWDADVSEPGLTKSVKVRLYARPAGTTTWTLLGTTSCYSITGASTSDVYYADVSGFPRGSWEFRLDLYECDGSSPAAADGKGFEELAYAIYGAAWTTTSDVDQDGCSESARLYWDADVSGDLTRSVEARIYSRPTGSATWSYVLTTNCYTITGTSSLDLAWVELSGGPGDFDFRIDLYECGGSSPVAVLEPIDDANLHDRCFEPTLTIFDAWWTNVVNMDGDGYWERGDLTWDADVVGSGASTSVQARVFYRVAGVSNWTLLGTTNCYTITGDNQLDTYAVRIDSNVPACYEFWIDLYDCGGTLPAARRGPGDDPDLDVQCFEP
ncbi:MAG: hypothetical protein A2V63_12010 [Candidatus Eisenbacteria bacterium RBG_19FT_COMBO_70_11]|nr:MAG: hypothetical protein A2V63_12010 [Candidatus Eisenbacteria bacterium RBG_19FT_COMBO_70_11]